MHLGIFAGKLEYRKAVTDRYSIEIGLGDRFLMWDMDGAPNFFKRKGALNGVFTRIERKRLKSVSFSKAGSGAYVKNRKFGKLAECERLSPITRSGLLNLNQSGTT